MSRRKDPAIPDAILDQLLAGGTASAAFDQGGLLDSLKKALTECALNAEMDHHLAGDDSAGNTRNGYGRDHRHRQVGDRRTARSAGELRYAADCQVPAAFSRLR